MLDMIINIINHTDKRISFYFSLTDSQLRQSIESKYGIFIAESPKVIIRALDNGYKPISLLCEKKHIGGDAKEIIDRFSDDVPIFTGERMILERITGYRLTRGVLCAMHRKLLPTIEEICRGASIVAVLYGITDSTNIGAIFRSAAALGVDGVILSDGTCDPLNRRAVRVSMGNVFSVPWTYSNNPLKELKEIGYATAALALSKNAMALDNPMLKTNNKIALIFGTEGDGLPDSVVHAADYVVTIPMSRRVDSLNVAASAAITFWELCH